MKLRAYTLRGPALFSLTPVVWVKVQFTQDNVKVLELEFHEFMVREKIYPEIRAGSSGGGAYSYAFTAEDAAKIKAWLVAKGCIESDEA